MRKGRTIAALPVAVVVLATVINEARAVALGAGPSATEMVSRGFRSFRTPAGSDLRYGGG